MDELWLKKAMENPLSVTVYSQVTSTNTLLHEVAQNGASEGAVIVAESQTAGRGRRGHTFWSPDSTGVYLSVLLRPTLAAETIVPLLTPAAAVAAARAVEAVSGRVADIKWVNDIYCEKKKVCGILTEGRHDAQTDNLAYAIVGVGFNVFAPANGFPEEIRDRAGAVLTEVVPLARERITAAFLNEFWALYQQLPTVGFHSEYRERCLRLGRLVSVPAPSGDKRAEITDITENFELRVKLEDGTIADLNAGDVSIILV